MSPYRSGEPPTAARGPSWRERLAAGARVFVAIALPAAVAWLVTIGLRFDRCAPIDYVIDVARRLSGAGGVALGCSVGVALLLVGRRR